MHRFVNPRNIAGRVPRSVLVTLAAFALLLLAVSVTMRLLIERSVQVDQVERVASEALARPLDAESVEVSALYGLVLRNVRIWDRGETGQDAGLMLRASTVRVRPSWWKLVRGQFEVASIRLVDADVYLRERRGGWNWMDLHAELAAQPTTAPVPAFLSANTYLHVLAPRRPVHGWTAGFRRLALTGAATRFEAELDQFSGRPVTVRALVKLAESTAELSAVDLPAEWLAAAGLPHRAEGLGGELRLTWAGPMPASGDRDSRAWAQALPDTLEIRGSLSGRRLTLKLPGRGQVITQEFRTNRIEGQWSPRMEDWSVLVEDLRLGSGDHPLRVTATVTGRNSSASTARVEWDGPVDRLLALAPASIVADLQKFRPRGPSAGRLVWQDRFPDRVELTALARGMAITVPAGIVAAAGTRLPAEVAELAEIRGRIQVSGGEVKVDTVAFTWDGDAVAVSGTWRPVNASRRSAGAPAIGGDDGLASLTSRSPASEDPATGGADTVSAPAHRATSREPYDLTISTPSFLVDRLAALLPEGVGLKGRVGATVRIQPRGAWGTVAFRDASLVHAAFSGPVRLVGGTMDIARDRRITLHEVAIAAGAGRAAVSGSVAPDESLDLSVELRKAELVAMAALGGKYLASQGISVSAGSLDGQVSVRGRRGRIDTTEGEVVFLGAALTKGERLAVSDLAGRLTVAADRLVAHELTAAHLGAPMRIHGTIPLADSVPWALALALGKARLEAYAEFLPEGYTAAGTAEDLALTLRGARKNPDAGGTARLTGATLRLPFLAAALADVRGEAAFSPDSFVARELTFRTGNSAVRVSGSVEKFAQPVFRRVTVHAPDAQIADLLGLLHESDRPLPRGAALTGAVDIDQLSIHGPIDRAEWSGAIVLKGGGAQLPGLRRGLTAVTGRLVFGEGRVRATSLAGKLGAADARLEGEMELADPYKMVVRLAVRDADLGDLFAALPKSDAAARIDLKGNGTIATTLDYNGRRMLVTGHLSDAQAEALGMPFSDVAGAFRYDGAAGLLFLTELAGAWAGGRADDGSIRLNLGTTPWSYEAKAQVRGIDLTEAMIQAGLNSRGYAGRVDADLTFAGRSGDLASINGAGWVKMTQARFEPLQPVDGISRTLRLDFFSRGTYETARGNFVIEKGVVRTIEPDHFLLLGRNYTLQARGYSSLEGDYAFNYACGLAAGLVGNVMTSLQIGRLFAVEGDGGVLRTAGTVSGRFGQPPTVTRDLGLLRTFTR